MVLQHISWKLLATQVHSGPEAKHNSETQSYFQTGLSNILLTWGGTFSLIWRNGDFVTCMNCLFQTLIPQGASTLKEFYSWFCLYIQYHIKGSNCRLLSHHRNKQGLTCCCFCFCYYHYYYCYYLCCCCCYCYCCCCSFCYCYYHHLYQSKL